MSEGAWGIGLAALGLLFGLGTASARAASGRATGTFEVKLAPVKEDSTTTLASARLALDKVYAGDLAAAAKGEMWTVDTGVKGSGAYVAIEKVTGTLRGRRGSFTLLHHGTMTRGADFKLTIVVVPDSGTEELSGLSGSMSILIEGAKHSYHFEYTLPDKP